MKIVIIGGGKVGYKLAEQLSEASYDIVMIDHNKTRLIEAINRMDINCFCGEAGDMDILNEAGVPSADLVIACTSEDECNMLACLIARRLGAKHTIARIRNPIYYHQLNLLKQDFHLSMVVNPEVIIADEITRLLILPDASKVETFVRGRVDLVEYPILENNPLIGIPLAELYKTYQVKVLICAVEHDQEVIIPDGDYVIRKGDHLHITASKQNIMRFFRTVAHRKNKIRNVMICGGGRVTYYLGTRLLNNGMNVKIIEKDHDKCELLSEEMPRADVIFGDATDQNLLREEGIDRADAFISLTGRDEDNIIMSLFAKHQGVSKVIVKINNESCKEMAEDFGLDSTVSAKASTADIIFGYVLAKKNSQGSANVETMYRLVNDQVEALEFMIKGDPSYTGVTLKELKLKPNILIATIARGTEIIIPSGNDCIMSGDNVIVISKQRNIRDMKDILA